MVELGMVAAPFRVRKLRRLKPAATEMQECSVPVESKKIGILGGSFNPPHMGHVDICRHMFEIDRVDQVWVVPCWEHPFGKPLAKFEDRITMCRFAFQDFQGKVWVSDVEKRLGGVSHTVRTLRYLKAQYRENEFGLIVGADVAGEQRDWKDFSEIRTLAEIIEVPRGKNSYITDISSTEIRDMIKRGERFDKYVPVPVAVYIVTHGLYHE